MTNEPKVRIKKEGKFVIQLSNPKIFKLVSERETRIKELRLFTINESFNKNVYDLQPFKSDYEEIGFREFDEIFIALSNELENYLSS